MRKIRGIEFPDSIADVVQKLVDRIEEKIGTSHLFSSKTHFGLKFALRLPDESKGKNKKAFRLFLLISPTKDGALARRPRPPKTGWKTKELTAATLDEVVRSGMSWFHQVQKMRIPDEYQDTENRLVLAGGQYESNRRRH
jgi:hypothetical protein